MNTKAFSLSGIALGNLRNRKRQNFALFLGIFLVVYFASASLLFGFGIYTTLRERHLARYGSQDVILFDSSSAPLSELMADGTLENLGQAQILAEVMVGDSDEDSFCVAQYDEEALDLANKHLKEGSYPRRNGEIALEQSALARLRTDAGVGDRVTLTLRIPAGNGGFLSDTVEKTYTLTGILYDQLPYWNFFQFERVYHDIPAGVLSTVEQIEPGGRAVTLAYGIYSDKAQAAQRLEDFCEKNNIACQGAAIFGIEYTEDQNSMLTGASIVIVGLLLLVACCLGIVNAYSANLDSRRRQIGLLRAVGATRRQIKSIFGRETLIHASASVPAALVLASLTVTLVFALMGEDYLFVLNGWVLLGVAVLSVGCIILAAGIPLRRASAVSPMQAIRDVDMMRHIKKKAIRSKAQFSAPRLIASRGLSIYKTRRVGISVMMAVGTMLFTVAFVFMTTMYQQLLISYRQSDYELNDQSYNYSYHDSQAIYGYHDSGISEGDRTDAASLPLVKTVGGQKMVSVKLLPKEITPYATADGWVYNFSYLSPDIPPYDNQGYESWYERAYKEYQQAKIQYGYSDYLSVTALGLDDDVVALLKPYVYEGEIDLDRINSGDEVLLIAPEQYNMYYMSWDDGSSSTLGFEPASEELKKLTGVDDQIVSSHVNDMFHVGDALAMSLLYTDSQQQYDDDYNTVLPGDTVRMDKTVAIGALLSIPDDKINDFVTLFGDSFLNVVTTGKGLSAMGFDVPYYSLSVILSEEPDAQAAGVLHEELERIVSRISDGRMNSGLEAARQNRAFALQLTAIAIALCVLMLALTASMVNNTISTHIRANKRSIGTQRAVGASNREIFSSYLYRVLTLFAWGGSIGYVLSVIAGAYLTESRTLVFNDQFLPLWQPLIFIALLLVVCVWNVRARLRGIMRKSITENIREL